MAWTEPFDFTAGPLTAGMLNAMLRDNMNETAVAKATTAGNYFVSTGENVLAERYTLHATRGGTIEVTSTTWTPHDTGPEITFNHSGSFLVLFSARIWATGGTADVGMVSPGTDEAGPHTRYAMENSGGPGALTRAGSHRMFINHPPGRTTVRLYYRASGSAKANIAQRYMAVLPF